MSKAKKSPQAPTPKQVNLKKVLHVGCGNASKQKLHATFHTPEWQEIRMDINPDVNPDIVADMTKMDMVEDNAMDAVWSSHNVEHLFAHQVPLALGHFYRVIKPGGFVLITLPDIQAVALHVAKGRLEEALYQSPAGPISPLDILYGFGKSIANGNHYMAHKTAFTAVTLGAKLADIGFCNVQVRRDRFDLWAIGYKLIGEPTLKEKSIQIIEDRARVAELPDELDVAPHIAWKPLGLKKSG